MDETTQRLRAVGQRVTPARVAVLDVLAAATARGEHLTADDVAERAAATDAGVHRATVYRALEALGEAGVLTHTHSGRGAATYHLAATSGGHAHVQCSTCGRIEDVDADLLDGVARRLAADRGFALDPGHAALLGTCAACAARPDR